MIPAVDFEEFHIIQRPHGDKDDIWGMGFVESSFRGVGCSNPYCIDWISNEYMYEVPDESVACVQNPP